LTDGRPKVPLLTKKPNFIASPDAEKSG